MNLILLAAIVLLIVLVYALIKYNYPLYVGFLILVDLVVIAWRLDLPEGWPRAVAFLIIIAVGVLMVWRAKVIEARK
jgi:hypothetical protein